jgi:methyltransferase (TIGR00027 family)
VVRENDDAWDLATSVGATAAMVAASRARANNEGLIDDRFAEPLVCAVGVDFFTRWATGELTPADVDSPERAWGMQTMTQMLAARTRYFDAFCMDAVRSRNIRQMVILASGLDARSYRLPWPQATAVFEIDQPDVIAFKTATLAALSAHPTADLKAVPVDLRHDWPSAMKQAGFDSAQPTAWLAEGLLGYLPPEAQDDLFDQITALSAVGSGLAAEVFIPPARPVDERADELAKTTDNRWGDQGFDLNVSQLFYLQDRNDAVGYLRTRGWRAERVTFDELLAQHGFPPRNNADGEAGGGNYYCTAYLDTLGQ